MRKAQTELERALGNLNAMTAHMDAMEHTLEAFSKQIEAAKHEMGILRLDLQEVQAEIRAAVERLQALRAEAEDRPASEAT